MNILERKVALCILYVWVQACVHTLTPTLPCSWLSHFLTYTPWYTWSAIWQLKRSGETKNSLFDSNSPLIEGVHHPKCHKTFSDVFSLSMLKKKKGKDYQANNWRPLSRMTYIRKNWPNWTSIMYGEADFFSIRKCKMMRKHLRNGNVPAFHVVEVYIPFSFHLLCVSDESQRMENQT